MHLAPGFSPRLPEMSRKHAAIMPALLGGLLNHTESQPQASHPNDRKPQAAGRSTTRPPMHSKYRLALAQCSFLQPHIRSSAHRVRGALHYKTTKCCLRE